MIRAVNKSKVAISKNHKNNDNNIVVFQNVSKIYKDKPIFKHLSFNIKKNDIVAIVGASGAGKTTTIKIMNGLESHDDGKVFIDGELLTDENQRKIRKKTAFVFQSFNLFPNMSVLKNITYTPTHVYKKDKDKIDSEAKNWLKKFNLIRQITKYPHELSGGQKQRVAIIRALILKPKILIMDEPTASLDPELTKDVADMIKKINQLGITIVIVSHDMEFVKMCCNNIIEFKKPKFSNRKYSNY